MTMDTAARAREIVARLAPRYQIDQGTFLDWGKPWELLVATILAAQCTDERVNMVTPEIFRRWPGPAELAAADQAELEGVIRSTGFFRNKAKNLIASARRVTETYGGELPRSMDELLTLPGVARKTANIVLTYAMGAPAGIAVDTHVKRLSFRMGFTGSTNPDRIEKDLCALLPRELWAEVNHLFVLHGRAVCTARKPACPECPVTALCPKHGVATA